MTSLLQSWKNGFRGLTSASSSARSSTIELSNRRSSLKEHIIKRAKEATKDIPIAQRKLVMSTVIPALDTVSDEQLLTWIKLVTDELVAIEKKIGRASCRE